MNFRILLEHIHRKTLKLLVYIFKGQTGFLKDSSIIYRTLALCVVTFDWFMASVTDDLHQLLPHFSAISTEEDFQQMAIDQQRDLTNIYQSFMLSYSYSTLLAFIYIHTYLRTNVWSVSFRSVIGDKSPELFKTYIRCTIREIANMITHQKKVSGAMRNWWARLIKGDQVGAIF